jgi:Flp pilus assembly protein TadD
MDGVWDAPPTALDDRRAGNAERLGSEQVETHTALGIALAAQGRLLESELSFRRVVQLRPDLAEAHNHLGAVLGALGRWAEATEHYRQALRLRPGFAAVHANLAEVLQRQGRLEEAVEHYHYALRLAGDSAETRFGLGNAYLKVGEFEEAAACYRWALQLRSDEPDIWNNLGTALWQQGCLEEAETHYRRALHLRPCDFEILNNLGNALREQGQLEEASACYREAVRLRGNSPEALSNLGVVLCDLGFLDEAESCFLRVLQLRPDWVVALDNLGTARLRQGRPDDALECYDHALRLCGDYAEAHRNRAMVWLACGDFARGWPEYEWRWRCWGRMRTRFSEPRWEGGDLAGRTILLHSEQGLGDTLQFIRYAPLVKQRGGFVVVVCPQPLVGLLGSCRGVEQILATGLTLPAFDVQAPLLSLPAILGTRLATVPAEVPYLGVEPTEVERWRRALSPISGFRIGVAWQGNPRYRSDRQRSFPLGKLAPLARINGVQLISLQGGVGTEQLGALAGAFPVTVLDGWGKTAGDIADTAAVMMNLDLVVTPDTALAHLAGGLGVRTWVALPKVAEWRWLMDRDDSPWYPTLRLFRQARAGDWESVFDHMADALEAATANQEQPVLDSGELAI